MLVLSRKAGEEITIGDDIVVKVTQIGGGRVRIGIDAPNGLKISRNELNSLVEQASNQSPGATYSSALR